MFKSKGKYVFPQTSRGPSPNRTSQSVIQDIQERTKWTPPTEVSETVREGLSPFSSPSPPMSNSPSAMGNPSPASSTTSKHTWETATVPLRNQRSMKIKYSRGPTPKLKHTGSAVRIYPDDSEDTVDVQDIVIAREPTSVDSEEEAPDGNSQNKNCSCYKEINLLRLPKEEKKKDTRYILINSEITFKIFWSSLCFSLAVLAALTLITVLVYYLLQPQ